MFLFARFFLDPPKPLLARRDSAADAISSRRPAASGCSALVSSSVGITGNDATTTYVATYNPHYFDRKSDDELKEQLHSLGPLNVPLTYDQYEIVLELAFRHLGGYEVQLLLSTNHVYYIFAYDMYIIYADQSLL